MSVMHERTDTICNSQDHPVQVWFEPWGMPHQLPRGKAFTVVTTSEIEGELEIEEQGDVIVVYAFPTALLKIFLDSELVDDLNIPFPDLPPNVTTKGFINDFFRRPES